MKRFLLMLLVLCLLTPSALAAGKGYTVRNGDRDTPSVALTIDDCINMDQVQRAVELCRQYNVQVTFFVVGKSLRTQDRQLWQDALDAGCEIGNHTWSHSMLPALSTDLIHYEMKQTQVKLDEVLGYHYPMQVMRPPWGKLTQRQNAISDKRVVDAIEAEGYLHAVKWDVSQTDAEKALKKVRNGSILLYHANQKDLDCLETLIPALLEQGYACVTVSQLLGQEAVKAE